MTGNEKMKKVKLALLTMIKHPWEHGTSAQAFLECGDDDIAILMAHEAVCRQLPDGRLAASAHCQNITDNCVCGEPVMFAHKKTGEEKYKIAAEKMLEFIDSAPCSIEGIQIHSYDFPMIAADCMYMVPPFYAVMGRYDDAVKQVDLRFNFLWNEEKCAIDHQWDTSNKKWFRKLIWGGGNGWNAAGIVRVLKALPIEMHTERARLEGYLEKLIDGVLKYQLKNGLFYDILDDKTSFVETNTAQMIAYSIYRGVTWGFLDKKYIPVADKMRAAANEKIDSMGYVQGVAGAPQFDSYGVSPEGQAFYILMETALAEYREEDNKFASKPASHSDL